MKNNYQEYNIKLYPQDFHSYKELSEGKVLSSSLHQDLQHFSHQIGYLSALHTNGKISTAITCDKLNSLWQTLDSSKN